MALEDRADGLHSTPSRGEGCRGPMLRHKLRGTVPAQFHAAEARRRESLPRESSSGSASGPNPLMERHLPSVLTEAVKAMGGYPAWADSTPQHKRLTWELLVAPTPPLAPALASGDFSPSSQLWPRCPPLAFLASPCVLHRPKSCLPVGTRHLCTGVRSSLGL